MALLKEAGHADTELELISLDDDFNRNTCDAVAAQMRDAGMKVKRTVLPGNTFWNNWLGYPFSSTEWNMRPLGVQVYALAYRTGVPWNETGFSNPEFDRLLDKALAIYDPDVRRETMAVRLEAGDRVVFFSDGLPEAPRPDGEPLGYAELERLLDLPGDVSPEEAVGVLLSRVAAAAGASPEDDATVLLLERRPA